MLSQVSEARSFDKLRTGSGVPRLTGATTKSCGHGTRLTISPIRAMDLRGGGMFFRQLADFDLGMLLDTTRLSVLNPCSIVVTSILFGFINFEFLL